MTQPVAFGNEPVVKDARLFANLSSAPGTNRIKHAKVIRHESPRKNAETI